MSMRTNLIPRVKERYITLRFNNIPFPIGNFQGAAGFLYVWYYLNGLSEEVTLLDMMKSESYYIPVPGIASKPIKPPSRIIPTPIEAYYFLVAFGIPYKDFVWGKWFLGLFPLDSKKDIHNRVLLDVIQKIPPKFIPPPRMHWGVVRTPGDEKDRVTLQNDMFSVLHNRFDMELNMLSTRESILKTGPPLSMKRFLGDEIKNIDLLDRYTGNISPYIDYGNIPRAFDEPFVALVSSMMLYLVTSYSLYKFSGDEHMTLFLHLEMPSPVWVAPWIISFHDGKWYTQSKPPGILQHLYPPDRQAIKVYFYRYNFPHSRAYEHCDRLIEDNLITPRWKEGDLPLSDAMTFMTGNGEFGGNLVVMASRSSYMLSILEAGLERGESILRIETPPVPLFVFRLVWNWMNGYDVGDRARPVSSNSKEFMDLMSYFLIDVSSPLSDKCLFSFINNTQKKRAVKILTEDGRDRMSTLNKLLPLSDIKPYVENIDITDGEILSSPFHHSTMIPVSEVKTGDFALLSYPGLNKIYRVKVATEGKVFQLDNPSQIIVALNPDGQWRFIGGTGALPIGVSFLRILPEEVAKFRFV